jgi:hypothetical protein
MSDQVVFTEEEVEKIRNAVYVMQKTFEVLKLDAIKQIPEEVLSLLDSPRPRPMISEDMLINISDALMDSNDRREDTYPIEEYRVIVTEYGFDVED